MYPGEYSLGRADSVRLPPSLGSRVASSLSPTRARGDEHVPPASTMPPRDARKKKNLTRSLRLDARVPQDSDDEPAPKRSGGRPAKGAKGDAPAKTPKRANAAASAAAALRVKPKANKKTTGAAKKTPRKSGDAPDASAPKKRGPGRPRKDEKARKRPSSRPPASAEKKGAKRERAAEAKPAPKNKARTPSAASGSRSAKGAQKGREGSAKPKKAKAERDADAAEPRQKAGRPRGRPPAESKGGGGTARKRKVSAPRGEEKETKKPRGAGRGKDVEREGDAPADGEEVARDKKATSAPAGDASAEAEAATGAAETTAEGVAKRIKALPEASRRSPEAARAFEGGPPPPVFVVHGQYRTAEEVTRDEVEMIIELEEEFARRGNFQRVYPLVSNVAYYERFFEVKRYQNSLIQAYLQADDLVKGKLLREHRRVYSSEV